MMGAPRYCEVYDDLGSLTLYEANGKNYIKMVGSDLVKIINNSSVYGEKYDGTDEPYVIVAVTSDSEPVDVSEKNDFDTTT